MDKLIHCLLDRLEHGQPVATATVVFQSGSTPRGPGSKLLAGPDGLLAGTVGGGLSEAVALRACREALHTGKPAVLDFALDGQAASDMICGGRMGMLVEPFFPASAPLPLLRALAASLHEGGGLLARPFPPTPHSGLIYTLTGQCLDAETDSAPAKALTAHNRPGRDGWREQAAVREIDGETWFVEPWLPAAHLILAGGGHVAQATAVVAALTGFRVTVLDNRPEFVSADRFPPACATRLVPEYHDCFAPYAIGPETYLVIVTHGHSYDGTVLAQALRTPAGYIGMIGSIRKRDALYANLRAQGVDDATLARVHCPIGLPIRAETPEEIAVSIMAECVAWRRRH